MDSHSETQAEAEIEGEAVASQSSGNGWTYTDADILGMVYPLHLSANDRLKFCAVEHNIYLTSEQRD